MNTKLVIFDLDNTLIDFNQNEKSALTHVFNYLNLEITNEISTLFSNIDHQLWSNGKYNDYYVLPKDIPLKRFEILFEIMNIPLTDANQVNQLFMEGLTIGSFEYNESLEIINYLKMKNYKVSIATNGLIKIQKPRALNTSFGNMIDLILVSEEVGASKPDPKIFIQLLSKYNIKAEEAIMIGDSLKNDIAGASKVGIKTIWFNHHKVINTSGIKPDLEISSLLEIKNYI